MCKRNIAVRCVGLLARKFRVLQEVWVLPWWRGGCGGGLAPWALDVLVLVVKLCSACAAAVLRVFIPPVMKSLHGETVLISGACEGVGRELALQAAALGATVVCWDRDPRANRALVQLIRNKYNDCYGFTVDATSQPQVSAAAARVRRHLADVSVVISAGERRAAAPLARTSPHALVHQIQCNLMAHVWVIQAFLPSMMERRYGHIVAVNSTAGLAPAADMAPYCAAKHGLKGLMDSLSEELRLSACSEVHTTSVYLCGAAPPDAPPRRFSRLCPQVSDKEAAAIIIEGIRKNYKTICIPSYMKTLVELSVLLPYSIRTILRDFFNFSHRGWFCFC